LSASVKEAIETSVVAVVAGVSGIALDPSGSPAVKAIPAGQMFDKQALLNEELTPQTRPGAYPGAVVSLVESGTTAVGDPIIGPSSAYARLRTPVGVAVYATSPSGGVVPNDARYKAWEVGEAIFKALLPHVPAGAPAGISVWPLQFNRFDEINVDATTHGLLIVFDAEYQIGVTQQ